MKSLLCLLLTILATFTATAQAAPDTEDNAIWPGRDLIPLLPFIFFDSGSAALPERYLCFTSPAETYGFFDTLAGDDPLEQHGRILDVIGYRLRHFPMTKISIAGYDSRQPEIGEAGTIGAERAQGVYGYLTRIWLIDSNRITLMKSGGWPQFPSNKTAPAGLAENRRAEILSDDWEIVRPIVRWREATAGSPSMTDRYWIIRWKFNSSEIGPLNEQILHGYLYPNISNAARIEVTGFDFQFHPMLGRSIKLGKQRAATVMKEIGKHVSRGDYTSLMGKGLGHSDNPFDCNLPEGRFYSQSVLVEVVR